jgi:hypothetical protein
MRPLFFEALPQEDKRASHKSGSCKSSQQQQQQQQQQRVTVFFITEGPRTSRHTLSFSPRPTAQIGNVSPLRWRTVTAKIYTSSSPAELVRHSSYNSSALPEILPSAPQNFPCPLALKRKIFSFFFLFYLAY